MRLKIIKYYNIFKINYLYIFFKYIYLYILHFKYFKNIYLILYEQLFEFK